MHAKLQTSFASAARRTSDEVSRQGRVVAQALHVCALLESFPVPAMVLNQERQLVAANQKLAHLVDRPVDALLGLRPGDVFNCIHNQEGPDGCGTSVFCSVCGSNRAILNTRTEECRMTCRAPQGWQPLDLRVQAAPLSIGPDKFTVVSFMDITSERRRMALEQMFFHDVLDTATGIQGVLDLLPGLPDPEAAKLLKMARRLSVELVEQIRAGRDLAAAERGELQANIRPVQVAPFLTQLCSLYRHLPICNGTKLEHHCSPESATISTDERLLGRVLGNLIKNALEASTTGQTVMIQFDHEPVTGDPAFAVHNQSAMPEPVRLQIFQRSFSTKAAQGRGIGTYSVKILTERYLKGNVSFTSEPGEGTTFTITLPQG
jgi:hypothetical protein